MMRDIVLKRTFATQYLTAPLYEGDGGYRLCLNCGKDLTGCEIIGKVRRSDGTIVAYKGETDSCFAYCRIEAGALTVSGEAEIRLEIVSAVSVVTAIVAECVIVEKLNGEDVTSDDRYPILTSLVNEVRQLKEDVEENLAEFPSLVDQGVQEAKDYADGILALNDAMVFRGVIFDNISAILSANNWHAGWTWKLGVANDYDTLYYKSPAVEVGDMLIAIQDAPKSELGLGNESINDYFIVMQGNVDGAVTSAETSSEDGEIPVFSGTNGRVIKKSGVKPHTHDNKEELDLINKVDDLEKKENKGVANGYTPLDEKAVVPDEHLPITREHTLLSNALKGTASGAVVALSDVSPVEHEVKIKVNIVEDEALAPESVTLSRYGKNLCPKPAISVSGTVPYKNGACFMKNIQPGNYVAQAKFKQTGTQTSVGINIRKVIRDEDGVISSYENMNTIKTSTQTSGVLTQTATITEFGEYQIQLFGNTSSNSFESGYVAEFTEIQFEVDNGTGEPTTFEEPVTAIVYTPNADGTVEGVTSIAPNMTLIPDTPNTYVDVVYNRDINKAFIEDDWKASPVLTIEVTEQCAAIDVTKIDGKAFEFAELAGYVELVTTTQSEGRLCIVPNKTASTASYSGLVALNANGATSNPGLTKGLFEFRKEYGMWHTKGVSNSTTTWLAGSGDVYEHWETTNRFGDANTITSFRLIPYSGNFNAGTIIKIYGKAAKA
ncbi:MAG: hypothetical protein IJ435_03800 [Clostridia bacterium]|nr:hypothetical protein [Clostridia bacterium]